MNTNNNSVAPMGTITAPVDLNEVSSNSRVKRQGVVMLTHGINLGVLYGFVDLGTHTETFPGSAPKRIRKLKLIFEHPQLKQLFYEDDTVVRSTVSSKDCSFSINEKSFLKSVIDAVEGRITTMTEATAYNVVNLLGKKVGVNIAHTPTKKDPTVFYEKVTSVISPNGLAIPHPFEPENKMLFFHIDKAGANFTTQNFADLPKYFRDEIIKSEEGQAHIAKGGKFAENPQQQQQAAAPVTQQAVAPLTQNVATPAADPVTMTPAAQFTREQYHASGWSDAQLVQNGLAVWNTPAAPAVPAAPNAPSAPAAPLGPQAPATFLNPGQEHDDLPF